MRTELFDYHLPPELIATRPPSERDSGRLIELFPGGVRHRLVRDLPELVQPGDLVVVNETRVRRARLDCHRPKRDGGGGARVELLFLQAEVTRPPSFGGDVAEGSVVWRALGRANRPLREGDELESEAGLLRVVGRGEQGLIDVLVPPEFEQRLAESGQMPIPPYMRRDADEEDAERYQTVFAKNLGSAAAPTAGLHLTDRLIEGFRARGAEMAVLTLHVGIGTFRPVKVDDLDDHPMHSEWICVDAQLSEAISRTRLAGGRVVAVGTTVVRALESAADPQNPGHVRPRAGETNLLIQPGYRFLVTDCLLTNFHMPRSTLLALVSAFGGHDRVLSAYKEAVEQRYRFLSYGDAMWLQRSTSEQGEVAES